MAQRTNDVEPSSNNDVTLVLAVTMYLNRRSNRIDIKVCVENAAQVEEAATSAVEENNNVNHKSNNCS